ncbi:FAD-dependent oxidoreductase [Sporosarcina sp. Marseille-Q4063]|uniref:FAD-dependent oxidoreductase n=1 Tax=Sporosarcina sp. Marseille-Q4063 TaxID=2810514 RepID=UPI001BB008A8|nr:FAD-dependent oxidoreductase [Sporosarcina sp. Marseille-Q4063]QUW22949.1 FAD-dependent oxidoreductase [Sporosarcina sp. Marseille-Q4063]
MDKLPGKNQSFWSTTAQAMSYPQLDEDIEIDTAVIGGGISGILTAYFLAKEGQSVALLEARELVSGTTGGTTAKLSSQHQLIYDDLLQQDGLDVAKLYYEANQEGQKLIKAIIDDHGIDCDYKVADSYVFSENIENTSSIEKEAEAYEKIGIEGGIADSIPVDLKVTSALVMKKQAQFNPVKFLYAVLKEVDSLGGRIYQHTRYMDSEKNGDQLILSTDTPFTVTCNQVVFATLFPAEDPDSFYSDTLKPVASHLTAFESPEAFDSGIYISDDDPIRTFRGALNGDQCVLIIGGETHPKGDGKSTIEHYEAIQHYAKEEFRLTEFLGYWSEHDHTTPDRRPFIGKIQTDNDKMYVMTGYGKWGLAASATGAGIIKSLIVGEDNRFEKLFSPERQLPEDKGDRNESNETDENHVVSPGSEQMERQLAKGQAQSVEINGKPAGMYKDTDGNMHYLDLSCTHLGCEVKWNDGDQTWDCPCHGSTFDGTGKVLAGPAKEPLRTIDSLQ